MGPVCRLNAPEIRFDVLVHGYDAANQVLRDPTFHVMDREYPDRRASARWREHPALRTLLTSVFFTEGPYHVRTRKLFSQAFTARRVLALEPAIVRLTEQRLDRLAELGAGGDPVDFVAEFALLPDQCAEQSADGVVAYWLQLPAIWYEGRMCEKRSKREVASAAK